MKIDPPIGTILTSWDRRRNAYRFISFRHIGNELWDRIDPEQRARPEDIVKFSLDGKYLSWDSIRKFKRQGYNVGEVTNHV